MTVDAIRELLHRDPFEPFRIRVSSGDSYIIDNPDLVAVMKNRLFVALPDGERSVFIPYLHIAAVETVNGNGRPAE